jgi:hypothetical protein
MTSLVKAKVSAVVPKQVPEFVREENQQFVKFLQAYYEWLEQEKNAGYVLRNLESSKDIDQTVDDFVNYFKKELLIDIPETAISDKRFLAKQINDLYRTKGTKQSYELLFRILFNEEAEIYYPKVDLLRSSDGKYDRRTVIKVIEVSGDAFNLIGQTITQPADPLTGASLATAKVESVIKFSAGASIIAEVNVNKSTIVGTFVPGARITGLDNTDDSLIVMTSQTMITDLRIDERGSYYKIGDKFTTDAGSGLDFLCEVATVKGGSVTNIFVANPGFGYRIGDEIIVNNTDTNGYGLRAVIEEVDRDSFMLEGTDLAVYSSTNVTFDAGDPTIETADTGLGRLSDTEVIAQKSEYLLLEDGGRIIPEGATNAGIKKVKVIEGGANYNKIPVVSPPTTPGSGAVLYAYGEDIGRIIGMNITNLGVYYEAKPTVASPVNAIINYLNGLTFAQGEAIFSEPEVLLTENETRLVMEDGNQMLLEEQSNGFGTYYSFDSQRNLLQLSPANTKNRITDESGTNYITFEGGSRMVTENSGEFTHNQNIRGLISGARARIVSVGHAEVTPIRGAVGSYVGQFLNADGKVSEASKKMQDNLFYQDFSYVVKVGQSIDKYRDAVKKLLHPVGLALFGEVRVQSFGNATMPSLNKDASLTRFLSFLLLIIDARMKAVYRDTILVLPRFAEANMRMHILASEFLPVLYFPRGEPLITYVLDMTAREITRWHTVLYLDKKSVLSSVAAKHVKIESKVLKANVKLVGGPRLGNLEKYKFFIPPYEAGTKSTANFNRDAWTQEYPSPNNGYWSSYGNTQIKDFGDIVLADVINNPDAKFNFCWDPFIDIVRYPPGSVTFDDSTTYITFDNTGFEMDLDTEFVDATDIYFDDNVTTMDSTR